MFPFSHSVTPAVRTHMNAQAAFLNDMTKSMSRSFQELCQLNMQLGQTLMEETTILTHQMLTTERPDEAISMTAARAQPASEKLRAYQQHISRVAADSQVEMARVAEQHVQETARTARALADEVVRTTAEETNRSMRNQEEAMRNFRDPFEMQRGNGSTQRGSMQSANNGMGGNSQHGDAEHAPFQSSLGTSQSSQGTQQTTKAGKSA
jgi:phasin family protein